MQHVVLRRRSGGRGGPHADGVDEGPWSVEGERERRGEQGGIIVRPLGPVDRAGGSAACRSRDANRVAIDIAARVGGGGRLVSSRWNDESGLLHPSTY